MKSLMTPISLLALAPLALCAPAASDGCAGWRPVTVTEQALDYLAAHDPQALEEMTAHAEFGKSQGCW